MLTKTLKPCDQEDKGLGQQESYITYGPDEGLAQSQVRAITQDKSGYLWLGTNSGLSRFDGSEFENFNRSNGLPGNQINCILQGSKLWVGTTGALSYVERNAFRSIPLGEKFVDSRILDLIEDKNGTVFIATAGQGVLVFDGKNTIPFKKNDDLPDQYIRSINLDQKGNLWIGSRSGLRIYSEKGEVVHPPSDLFSGISVSDIGRLKDDRMVVTTFGNGIFICDGSECMNYLSDDGLPGDYIRCFASTMDGDLWFGSKLGLARLSNGIIKRFDGENGLAYSNIKSLGVDSENNLWIGSDGQGLIRRTGNLFISYTKKEGLGSELVMSFSSSKNGDLLIGTYDEGLFVLEKDSIVPSRLNEVIPSKTVWSIDDHRGNLLVGTSSGLVIERGNSVLIFDKENGLPGKRVMAICPLDSVIYLGTESGIGIVNSSYDNFRIINEINGEKITGVRSIIEAERTILVGSDLGLIALNSTGEPRLIESLPSKTSVYCLKEDSENGIWVGTSNGLYYLSSLSSKLERVKFTSEYGSDNINFLTETENLLMIGTNRGLYSFDLSSFRLNHSTFIKHYTEYEGLVAMETNQNAVFERDGVLWFGTTEGIVRFDPISDTGSNSGPSVHLSGVDLFLQEVDWEQLTDSVNSKTGLPLQPKLKYNQNYLSFNYGGVYFSNPEKVRYEYLLEGLDEDWLGPTESRTATYAYLPHGDFTFKVRSYQVDNPTKVSEAAFAFSIDPPFYLTPWFFALTIIFVAGLVYLIYFIRLKQEREKQAAVQIKLQNRLTELESQSLNSSMNRHFIFNALNSIQYYINMQDRKSANKYLTSFAKLIRKNLDSSQEVDTSLQDELERLELYLSLEQMRFQGRFDYRIEIDPSINTDSVSIPAMILQPFLENSIWHGILPSDRHGEILIHIAKEDEDCTIEIQDNGVGINTSLSAKASDNGNHDSKGMEITLNRIKLQRNMTGLNYQIEGPSETSNKNGSVSGTKVIIRIPMKTTVNELKGLESWKIAANDLI